MAASLPGFVDSGQFPARERAGIDRIERRGRLSISTTGRGGRSRPVIDFGVTRVGEDRTVRHTRADHGPVAPGIRSASAFLVGVPARGTPERLYRAMVPIAQNGVGPT
jgi:hypothetical protein